MSELKASVFTKEAKSYFIHGEGKPTDLLKLLKNGYAITPEDRNEISKLHGLLKGEDYLVKWSRLRFMVKLEDYSFIKLAIKKEKVLFTILSIKLGKPIRFNYPNLLAVMNNALEYYRESGDAIINALHHFGQWEMVLKSDKKEVFIKKFEQYENNKPLQDENLNEVIGILFPELNNGKQ